VSQGKLSKTPTHLWRVEGAAIDGRPDVLATEEPLEIRLRWEDRTRTVALTMRTPGADAELAAGFLFAEGVVADRSQIARMTSVGGPQHLPMPPGECSNEIEVELAGCDEPDLASLERHFFSTSACGVCGKAGLETLRLRVTGELPPGPRVAPAVLCALPAKLRAAQGLFEATGGLHAAALFTSDGELLAVREDVGRHNALDKLVGWAMLGGMLPLHDHLLLVSGRTSYEILQKSAVAGLPVVCAVSAPSSLAVELAERFGITLIGFLRGNRFNVYSGLQRITGAPAVPQGAASAEPRRFTVLQSRSV
jgi:FdhD protein